MEISTVISCLSLAVAIVVAGVNIRRGWKSDDKEMTTVIVKLDTINDCVSEIKGDVKTQGAEMVDLRERLIWCEQSTKSAHQRIDKLEGRN